MFQLEAGREGLCLRLGQAFLGTRVQVRNLVLSLRRPPRSLDLSAGPRSLQSVWSLLQELEILVPLETLRGNLDPSGAVEVVRPIEGGTRLWVGARVGGIPWTFRLRPGRPHQTGDSSDLELVLEEPRAYGPERGSWVRTALQVISGTLPGVFGTRVQGNAIRLRVLPPLLRALLAERGWKIPDHRGAVFLRSLAREGFWVLQFGRSENETLESPMTSREVGDWTEDALRERFRAGEGPDSSLLVEGLRHPRLWPEVLRWAGVLGDDRPDRVLPALVTLIIGSQRPGWVSAEDQFHWTRRLVRALSEEEGLLDLRWACGWIASTTRSLAPSHAWTILEEMLSLGIAEPELLRQGSCCLEVLDRSQEARAMRNRLLALVNPRDLEGVIRQTIEDLDTAGLSGVADQWIQEVSDLLQASGTSDASTLRVLRKTRVVRRIAEDPEGDREALWSLWEEDPLDPEVQAMVRLANVEDAQAYDWAMRAVAMAEQPAHPARRELLRFAASLVESRPGLRWRAIRWYENSLEGDPNPGETLDALERLYRLMDREDDRHALLLRRLAAEPEAPQAISWRMELAETALRSGDLQGSADHLREVIRRVPAHREALEMARRIASLLGDREWLQEIEETLRDLHVCLTGGESQTVGEWDQILARLLERGDEEELLNELARLAAEAIADPPGAVALLSRLRRVLPETRSRWGEALASDLLVLGDWVEESLSRQGQ